MRVLILASISTLELVEKGRSIRNALKATISKYPINKDEESTLYYTVFEIYRRLNVIDLYIKLSSSNYSIKKIDKKTKAVLRLVTYWMKIEEKPTKLILEELNAILKSTKFKVNIRVAIEDIKNITKENLYENRDDIESKLSLQYFTPTWMIRKFFSQWDNNFSIEFLKTFLTNLPTYIRINPFKTNITSIKKVLDLNKIEYSIDKDVKDLIKIVKTDIPIPQLKEFQKGEIVIQQKASTVSPLVLCPQPGDRILDMCASPGSKTSQISGMLGGGKNIIAVEIKKERLDILKNRMSLLGIKDIEYIHKDARNLDKKYENTFDKILLDPPCTGSGTFSSRPDSKFRIKRRDIKPYLSLQSELLEKASTLVKTNGKIVYSTCSVFKEENQEIIGKFLEKHGEFTLEKAIPFIGLPSKEFDGKCQELFPHIHQTEGFFIAKLSKNA